MQAMKKAMAGGMIRCLVSALGECRLDRDKPAKMLGCLKNLCYSQSQILESSMRYIPLLLCLISSPAAANNTVTWGELFAPERLVQSVAQTLVLTIRSFTDVTYTSLDVDIRRNSVTVRNIKAYPLIAMDFFDCEIEIRRLELGGAGLESPEKIKLTLRADDLHLSSTCLTPLSSDLKGDLVSVGLTTIHLPRVVIQVDYHIPSANAQVTGIAVINDLAELSFDVDLDYFWIDASQLDPYPVIYLERAEATFSNLGIWNLIQEYMPPEAVDPNLSPAILQLGAAQMFVEAGADERFALGFSAQMGKAWSDFLAEPEVLAAAFMPEEPVYIDIDILEESPGAVLADLAPTVSATKVTQVLSLPTDLLRTALSTPSTLSSDERLIVGRQLLTGIGVPRDVAAGVDLLLPLAVMGDEAALDAIANLGVDAFRAEDYAKVAMAAIGQPSLAAVLDDQERRNGLAMTLELQPPLDRSPSFDGIVTVRDLRSRALANLEGRSVPRSFARAAYWAYLGAAAGDMISRDIIDDIAGRAITEEDRSAWEPLNRAAADRAMEDWIAVDLPGRLQ